VNGEPIIVWFQRDLRLRDHPALHFATERGPVVLVFIDSPAEGGGGAGKWWLHHSLSALGESLAERGLRLIIRSGCAEEVLGRLRKETGARAVFWNRQTDPAAVRREGRVKQALRGAGCEVKTFDGSLLVDPAGFRNRSGRPFQVFTPFWNACRHEKIEKPWPVPRLTGVPATGNLPSLRVEDLKLLPRTSWDRGFYEMWKPGEAGARAQMAAFLARGIENYLDERDHPASPGTSRLSPHLHWGEVSIRDLWHAGWERASQLEPEKKAHVEGFLRQLGWREFSHHLLFHYPDTLDQPLREEFRAFPWDRDEAQIGLWQKGQTGYPLVDAGMRELWSTGWMHNRVRMVVASFLVKHLLVPWQEGARWFMDTLVDADEANNSMGWQWSAGCGADAAPWFRVFNPVLQGRKFDPEGTYVRRWVPELSRLPSRWIHEPWAAPPEVLRQGKVRLGEDYPRPIVDHATARTRALQAYEQLKENR
jgi:deoxyribodipyrimidine photo-lyase